MNNVVITAACDDTAVATVSEEVGDLVVELADG